MGSDSPKPLTTEQAKARLRAAATDISPRAWFQRHPLGTLGLAAACGFMLSRTQLSFRSGVFIAQWLTPILLERIKRRPGS